jgi:HrpA-like RNA helicase
MSKFNVKLQDGAKLGAEIKSIGTAGAKLDARIQEAALAAIWHFGVRTNAAGELIGDVGYINRLYKALGKGARHVALTDWLTTFGGVKANTAADKADNPFVKDKNKVVDMDGASALPWFDMKPSKAPDEVFDYYSMLLKVLNKKAKEGQTIKGAEMAAKVRKLVEEEMAQATQAEAEAKALAKTEEAPL